MAEDRPRDSDEERLRFILEGQRHCDHFLTPLAEPRGKSVLVVGAGAGTEMLWCLRQGAREVIGIDVAEQSPAALDRAVEQLGIAPVAPFSILRLGVEEADTLGRRFGLVLSNNVFEHLPDLGRALAVCAELVAPGTGRVAVFTAPLYYSSAGSHLPNEPWEHLWAAPADLRRRLLGAVAPHHPLHGLDLPSYLYREISLNRMLLSDLLQAVRESGLVLLNLRLLRDRNLQHLPEVLPRLEAMRRKGIAVADLALEGVSLELARLGEGPLGEPPAATEEAVLARQRGELEERYASLARRNAELQDEADRLREEARQAGEESRHFSAESSRYRQAAAEARRVLDAVEASWSFRLGRLLTAPGRWVRGPRRP